MSRQKKGATSEGKVTALKEGVAEAPDSTPDLVSMMKTILDKLDKFSHRVQALELKEQHPAGNPSVPELRSGERSRSSARVGEEGITPPEQQPQPAPAFTYCPSPSYQW